MHLARRSLVEESEVSPRVSAGSFFLETPPPSKQHASSRRLIASASPNEADRDDAEESETDERESVLDWEVAGLMREALSRVEGRITSFDNRHVILLLEALALVGFAVGPVFVETYKDETHGRDDWKASPRLLV
uniref:Putative transmembrane protein n=1 Tax=Toxoplasma gondii TgCATBr9 TaxID=943120 RepID=A0A2T6IPY0_TOXGO|nr:putative transmembrane protein [Toxoplasma gondii TgCATBr9]